MNGRIRGGKSGNVRGEGFACVGFVAVVIVVVSFSSSFFFKLV